MLYPTGTTTRPRVSSPYGPRDPRIGVGAFHHGADLIGFDAIHAVASGRVTFAGWMNAAAGNTVVIDHGGGVTSVYMHNERHHVRKGDTVSEGAHIADMGDTGNATGECNHLEIRVRGKSVEPLAYIAARLTQTAPNTTHPNPTTKEEEPMLVNIQGHAGKRSGGAYFIANGVATYLGPVVVGLPLLTTAHADALAKAVSGL
ncbi:M23 family metallopeptidase [Streptomyces sp. AC495_CC817]|uniref:M23 family metallopeptidase n=1 Tax=Streptomyces sp. AC495_CC817 TaxID=2823900 RepID=UPI001C25E3DA|nr:M23 family metallopeptidase [Streptomyces sp. AC495_CC817]